MKKTVFVAEVAVFAALVFVATIVIAIPSAATSGYVNFGDTVIFIAAAFLGPIGGLVAGGIGSMFADLVYSPAWMPVTLIVKGLEGLIAGLIFKAISSRLKDKKYALPLALVVGFVVAAVEMVVGYYIGGAIILGISTGDFKVAFASSAVDIPGNCLQGGVSVLVGTVISLALAKIPYTKRIMDKNSAVFTKRKAEAVLPANDEIAAEDVATDSEIDVTVDEEVSISEEEKE